MNKIQYSRLKSIDGLRGIACLLVVCFHFFYETFKNNSSELYNFYTRFIFDGQIAVAIFFIISGEALSASFIERQDAASIFRPAIKRWPRLSIPVFFSATLVFFISKMHLVYNQQASVVVNGQNWLGSFLKSPPHVIKVLTFSFISVFGKPSTSSPNPFLWTMHFEFIGSFFLFFLFFLFYKNVPYLIPFFTIIMFPFLSIYSRVFLPCFILGFLICYARKNGFFQRIQSIKKSEFLLPALIYIYFIIDIISEIFYFLDEFLFFKSGFLIIFVLSNVEVCNFLDSKPIQFLGKISFPLFLVQFPVLISFTSYLIIKYYTSSSLLSPIIIATTSVMFSILLSTIFYPIEILTQNICNYIYKKAKMFFHI